MKKLLTLLIVIGWLMPEKLSDCLNQYWQQAHQYFISKSDT